MNKKRVLLWVAFLNIVLSSLSQEQNISGQIISKQTHEPVPWASIVCIANNPMGTSTDNNGCFILKNIGNNAKLLISSIGYKDTIINISSSSNKMQVIELSSQIYQLPEVTISNKGIKKYIIGKPYAPVVNINGMAYGFPSKAIGFYHGIHISPSKKQIGCTLMKLYVYITKQGTMKNPFLIRFLGSSEKLYPNRNYNSKYFIDLTKESILFSPSTDGWTEIDISRYNIKVPSSFMIMFSPLKSEKSMTWIDENGEWYGAVIGTYLDKKMQHICRAIKIEDTFVYTSTPNSCENVPAIAVLCSE